MSRGTSQGLSTNGPHGAVGTLLASGLAPAVAIGLLVAALSAGTVPLLDPDEGRNAEVARETVATGDWIVPHFHGLPYLDKPALYFDLVALSFRLFGPGELPARLPSIGFAIGTLLVTWLLARRLVGPRRAPLAVSVLASAPLFVLFARTVIFDSGLAFFVTLAIYLAERGRQGDRWGFALSWVATSLAVLTKGPVGLLLPLLAIVGLSLGRGRPFRLRAYFRPASVLVLPACLAPWVAAVEAREPGFLRYALLTETFERLTRPTFQRGGPFWYYVPILLLGLFPWSVAALARSPAWFRAVARGALVRPSADRGLLIASAAIVLFFSLSRSKLGGYVLPAMPLLAILLSGELVERSAHPRAWTLVPGLFLMAVGFVAVLGPMIGLPLASWMRLPESLAGPVARLFTGIGIVCGCAGILLGALSRFPAPAPILLSVTLPAIVLASIGPFLSYADENSSKRIASHVRASGCGVVAVRCFPVGLDYYLERIVPVVTESGREITSTYVERNFDRIAARSRGEGNPGIWSPADYESRLRAADPDRVGLLITRADEPPAPGYRRLDRVGRYRLWILAGADKGPHPPSPHPPPERR